MNNQAFSRIWIVVILVVVIAGGIFVWQYFEIPEEVKMPEEEKETPKEEIEAMKDKKLIVAIRGTGEGEILHFTTPEEVERKTIKLESEAVSYPYQIANNKIYHLKEINRVNQIIGSIDLKGKTHDLEFTFTEAALEDFLISPDGKRIVWNTSEGYMGKDRQIFVADIDGKNKKLLDFKLPEPFVFIDLLRWSSDGQHIYFVFFPVINGVPYLLLPYLEEAIFKVNVNSEEITPIFDMYGEISPDERKIAYLNWKKESNEIVIKDLITGNRIIFPVETKYSIASFAFSPDNKHLAVTLGLGQMVDERFKTIVINLDRKEKWVIVPENPDYKITRWLTNERIILEAWHGGKKRNISD